MEGIKVTLSMIWALSSLRLLSIFRSESPCLCITSSLNQRKINMIWMVIGLNLGLSGLCLWTVAKLLKIRRRLRRTNRSLNIAIQNSHQVFSAAPDWWDEKQISLQNLHSLMSQYGIYWQQLHKTYLLFLFLKHIGFRYRPGISRNRRHKNRPLMSK
jgi:hypothetical protein